MKKRLQTLAYKRFVFPVVPRTGFEPMTYCLEGSCSIQLSYRGILFFYCRLAVAPCLRQAGIQLSYRGILFFCCRLAVAPCLRQAGIQLSYRGILFRVAKIKNIITSRKNRPRFYPGLIGIPDALFDSHLQ